MKITLVKPISICSMQRSLTTNFSFPLPPISFALWHTSSYQKFIRILPATKSYALNLGHKIEGKGLSLLGSWIPL